MSQDIGAHCFTAFPSWHAYHAEGKCAECLQARDFPLHTLPFEGQTWCDICDRDVTAQYLGVCADCWRESFLPGGVHADDDPTGPSLWETEVRP